MGIGYIRLPQQTMQPERVARSFLLWRPATVMTASFISLAKAIGLDVDIMRGDEAYGDGPDSDEIRRTTGVKVVTPPRSVMLLR